MIASPCNVCRTDPSPEDAQARQLVRCPSCLTTLRVPSGATDPASALHAMTTPPPAPPGGAYGPPRQQYGPPAYGGMPYPPGGAYGGAPYGPPGPWGMPRGAGRRYGFN